MAGEALRGSLPLSPGHTAGEICRNNPATNHASNSWMTRACSTPVNFWSSPW
jgi:hypothetical protein